MEFTANTGNWALSSINVNFNPYNISPDWNRVNECRYPERQTEKYILGRLIGDQVCSVLLKRFPSELLWIYSFPVRKI